MSKRKIESALRKKGLKPAELNFSWQPTPEESVPCWHIRLDDDSEEKVAKADPDFDNFEPDLYTSADVLAWVDGLPDCSASRR